MVCGENWHEKYFADQIKKHLHLYSIAAIPLTINLPVLIWLCYNVTKFRPRRSFNPEITHTTTRIQQKFNEFSWTRIFVPGNLDILDMGGSFLHKILFSCKDKVLDIQFQLLVVFNFCLSKILLEIWIRLIVSLTP